MATMYAVHKGYGDPEICDTLADAEQTAKWYTDHPYWNAHNESGHEPGEIEEIPASLPSETGIRTIYDITDTDAGGYRMGYYPASIEDGHAEMAGDGPLCADCACLFLRDNADDETVTLFGDPEYESDFGEYCEDCGKSLCEPHCFVCRDVREEGEKRDWYTDDSHGYVCPRCMAAARMRGNGHDVPAGGTYADYATAARLAPGTYDVTMYEHDGTYNGAGLFYAPSSGHHVADVYASYHAAHAW